MPVRLPQLWDLILPSILKDANWQDKVQEEEGNQLIFGLQVLEIMAPSLDKSLLPPVLECLPRLCILLAHPYKAVRHMTSRCIATLASLNAEKVGVQITLNARPHIDIITINIMRNIYFRQWYT